METCADSSSAGTSFSATLGIWKEGRLNSVFARGLVESSSDPVVCFQLEVEVKATWEAVEFTMVVAGGAGLIGLLKVTPGGEVGTSGEDIPGSEAGSCWTPVTEDTKA